MRQLGGEEQRINAFSMGYSEKTQCTGSYLVPNSQSMQKTGRGVYCRAEQQTCMEPSEFVAAALNKGAIDKKSQQSRIMQKHNCLSQRRQPISNPKPQLKPNLSNQHKPLEEVVYSNLSQLLKDKKQATQT